MTDRQTREVKIRVAKAERSRTNNNNNNNKASRTWQTSHSFLQKTWTSLSGTAVPSSEARHIQKAWDRLVAVNHIDQLISKTSNDVDKTRLLAATATHSGDWLQAAPIASVGLKLSDEAVRVAVAHRLGCRACEPHTHTHTCAVPVERTLMCVVCTG